MEKLRFLAPPVSVENLYVGFSKARGKQHKKLAENFSNSLKQYKKTPEYRVMMSRFGYSE